MTDGTPRRKLRARAVPIGVALAAIIVSAVFHSDLRSWFTGPESAGSASKSAGTVAQAGVVSIDAAIEPETPRQGTNTLIVTVTRNNVPMRGAKLDVQVWMPAMGSMPEMRTTAELSESDAGVYRAGFDLSMGGSWTATIALADGDETVTAEYGLTVGTSGLRSLGATASGSGDPAAPALSHEFSAEARAGLIACLDAYEAIRAALVIDTLDGVPAAGEILARAFENARAAEDAAPAEVRAHLDGGAAAARSLGVAATVDDARRHFSALSEHLVALTAADAALVSDRRVFECPMWDGYNKWIQRSEKTSNPYMGQAMPTCGSEQPWSAVTAAAEPHSHDPDEISHYTCSMHPWVKKDNNEEICPVCSMKLTPVTKQEVTEGIIRIDRERRQAFGVTTAKVTTRRMLVPIRAVGRVAYDERRLADVTLKYKGWVEKLFVEETGQRVKRGQALFAVYSPELFAAQHELILAAKQTRTAATETQQSRATALLRGARKRMRLWDLSDAQIDAIIATGEPKEQITVRSPAAGYVIEKDIVEGAAVEPGERLFRIADLDRVWVEADVYEQDTPLIEKGQAANIRLTHTSGKSVTGKVSFIYPYIEDSTRTARVRVELDNRDRALKPDMFAEVDIAVDHGDKLVVPEPAIVYSGPRRIVFVDIGQDRLRPTVIEIGAKSGGFVEVTKGLSDGDTVVVSGNFLVAAESRLKSTTGIW